MTPSPVPESGLTLETTAEERAAADAWLATDGCPEDQFDRRIIRDLTAAMQEIERLNIAREIDDLAARSFEAGAVTRAESAEASAREAWAELSKERLERRIVEETAKRDRWHMDRFKASARSARAEALEEAVKGELETYQDKSTSGSPNHWFIQTAHGKELIAPRVYSEAYARLFVAAPRMLEALEPFALVAAQQDEHYDNPDHYSPTIEDFRRARAAVTAIRSLKTAPKGDGEGT